MKLNIQLFASVSSAKYDGRYLKLSVVEESYSIENNTSTLKWTFESIGGSSSYYSIYNYGAYVNGTQVYDGTSGLKSKNYSNHSLPVTKGSTSGTITITHKDDGSADPVPFVLYGKVYKSGTASFTGSVDLTTIPRASQPSLVTWPQTTYDITMGNQIYVHMNRVSPSFTHSVYYNFGSLTNQLIATNVTDNCTWTPPLTMANQIPSSTSGVGSVVVKTYDGSTLVGEKSVSFRANVPSSVVPSVSFTRIVEAGDVPSSWGIYVKSKSRVGLTISGNGAYSSSISSYRISYYGGAVTTASATTSYLTQAGSTTFTGQVTDTRGRSATTTSSPINVVDYSNPTISTAQVQRCDIDGNIDNNGEYLWISYGASISPCSNQNTPSAVYKVGYRVHNTGSYQYVPLTTSVNSYSVSGMLFTDGIKAPTASGTKVQFSSSNTYDIQFYVKDYFMEYTNVQSLDTGFDLMNFNPSGKSMAIGKVSEASANEELFEVGMNTDIDGDLDVNGNISMLGDGDVEISMKEHPILLHNNNGTTFIGANNHNITFRPKGLHDWAGQMYIEPNGTLFVSLVNGQIEKAVGTWWMGGRTDSIARNTAKNSDSYNPVVDAMATNGDYSFGTLGNSAYLVHTSDSDFAAQNNVTNSLQIDLSQSYYCDIYTSRNEFYFHKRLCANDFYSMNGIYQYGYPVPRCIHINWGSSMQFSLGEGQQALVMLNHDQMCILWSVSGGTALARTNIVGSAIQATISNSTVTITISGGGSFAGTAFLSP